MWELMRSMRWTAHSVAGLARALEIRDAGATKLTEDLCAAGLVDVDQYDCRRP
jgi:hypothetical protein